MTSTARKIAVARYSARRTLPTLSGPVRLEHRGGPNRFGLGTQVLDQTGDVAAYTTLLIVAVLSLGIAWLPVGSPVDSWN